MSTPRTAAAWSVLGLVFAASPPALAAGAPAVELGGGPWAAQLATTRGASLAAPAGPAWVGEATLRLGRWGLAGRAVAYAANGGARPGFYAGGTHLIELEARRRLGGGLEALAGYRVLTQHPLDFVTAGLRWQGDAEGSIPVALRAEARGGLNGGLGWTVDLEAAATARLIAGMTLEAGVRGMGVSCFCRDEPITAAFGPTAGLRLAF